MTYCSRECQRADWKSHRKSYNLDHNGNPFTQPNAKGPTLQDLHEIFKIFTFGGRTIDTGNLFDSPGKPGFLSGLSEHDALAAIIDSYRLRAEDEFNLQGDAGGLYADQDPLPDLKRLLGRGEKWNDILPSWWNKAKRNACVQQALGSSEWSDIKCAVEK